MRVQTTLEPLELLGALLEIERSRGRERRVRWGPRTLDLDLLAFGGLRLETPELTLPHPRLLERNFVLVPMADVAGELVLPGAGRSVADLARSADPRRVRETPWSI